MTIRKLESCDDRMALSKVYEAGWKYAYKGIIPQDYLDSIPEGKWAQAVDRPGIHTLVMLEGDLIIGTTSVCAARCADRKGFGEVVSIYFLPEYMGKGYGKLLLAEAVKELEKMGFDHIYLQVLEENHRARRFYEKCGFRFSGCFVDDNIGGRDVRQMQYCYTVAEL